MLDCVADSRKPLTPGFVESIAAILGEHRGKAVDAAQRCAQVLPHRVTEASEFIEGRRLAPPGGGVDLAFAWLALLPGSEIVPAWIDSLR